MTSGDEGSKELEKQPFSSRYPIYVINMKKRKDKWDGIKTRYKDENLTWSEGFNVKENYSIVDEYVKDGLIKPPRGVIKYGNLGCAFAHMNVWKQVAQGKEKCTLVLEDDSKPTDQYLQGLYNCIEAAPDFDIIKMVVIRPTGDDMNKHGLLKVKPKQNLDETLPNVWLCAYLLSKSGASKLLDLFKKKRFDLNNTIIDWAMTLAMNDSTDFSAYVVKDQRYFVHDESDSDRRAESVRRAHGGPVKYSPEIPKITNQCFHLLSACVTLVLILVLMLILLVRLRQR